MMQSDMHVRNSNRIEIQGTITHCPANASLPLKLPSEQAFARQPAQMPAQCEVVHFIWNQGSLPLCHCSSVTPPEASHLAVSWLQRQLCSMQYLTFSKKCSTGHWVLARHADACRLVACAYVVLMQSPAIYCEAHRQASTSCHTEYQL